MPDPRHEAFCYRSRTRRARDELKGDGMKTPRILVADDHVLVAEAISSMLAPAYDVVGTVSDGRSLIDAASTLKPDVIIVDIGMPLLNGIDAARQIKRLLPRVKIIIVTMNEDSNIVGQAFGAGASGYLLKHSASKELLFAIQEVLKGGSYLSPRITSGAVDAMLRSGTAKSEEAYELTLRQREVIQLLAEGRSMKEISDILTISLRTVAAHKYRVMELLSITTNAELYRYAVRNQMVTV
jgi:DNA-binding NarL/FixJ family response regulator